MAAILENHRYPLTLAGPARPPRRADLRLVHSAPSRPAVVLPRPHAGVEARVVVAACVAVMLAMFLAVAIGRGAFASLAPAPVQPAAAQRAGTAGAGQPTLRTVVVQPGDSMWSIARRMQPTGEIRGLVDELVALHGSTTIVPGEHVAVPS